jgi:hypothetical protein
MTRLAQAYRVGHIFAGLGGVLEFKGKELAFAQIPELIATLGIRAFGNHCLVPGSLLANRPPVTSLEYREAI